MTETIRYILEIIGTVAFAVSGALAAIGAGLDIFGVLFIGVTTAVGGGILRDIILGNTPPNAFLDPTFCFVAIAVAALVFVLLYVFRRRYDTVSHKIDRINNFFDAAGLAAFTVTGAEITFTNGFSHNLFVVTMLGMITGAGGGIIRDILIDTTPFVLRKRIYATASIVGGVLYYAVMTLWQNSVVAAIAAMSAVIAVRMLATVFQWDLPTIKRGSDV